MILTKEEYLKLYNQHEKPASTIFHKYISKNLARFFTFFFLRYRITPNTISFLTLLLVSISVFSLLFVDGLASQIAFLILLQVSYAFDCSDGVVARITGKTSAFGAFFDITLDRINVMILYSGLGIYININNDISLLENTIFLFSAIFYYQYQVMALLRANYFSELNGFMKKQSNQSMKKNLVLYLYEFIDTGIFFFIISISIIFNFLFYAIIFYGFIGFVLCIALYVFLYQSSRDND
tara:strand:- start:8864 stop:9577 length:714 start_codon:yes stop_codon:yes gene_type:complete